MAYHTLLPLAENPEFLLGCNNICYRHHQFQFNVAIGGIFKAHSGLDQLRGQTAAGTYSLLASDVALGDTGKVEKWCLHGWVGNALPVTPTPTPTSLPDSAREFFIVLDLDEKIMSMHPGAFDWGWSNLENKMESNTT